jgi:glutaredoxin
VNPAQVVLLTRQGCSLCERTAARLAELADELGFELTTTDVDAEAAAGDPVLRAEFGDRLPVVLLGSSTSPGCGPISRSDLQHPRNGIPAAKVREAACWNSVSRRVSKFGSPAGERLPLSAW